MFPQNKRQKGFGMRAYKGVRYQRGNGIFGSLMKNAVYPLLRYLGVNGFSKMGEFAQEAIANPSELKNIAKRKAKEFLSKGLDDTAKRAKVFVQTGKGIPPPTQKPTFLKHKLKRANKGRPTPKGQQKLIDSAHS